MDEKKLYFTLVAIKGHSYDTESIWNRINSQCGEKVFNGEADFKAYRDNLVRKGYVEKIQLSIPKKPTGCIIQTDYKLTDLGINVLSNTSVNIPQTGQEKLMI